MLLEEGDVLEEELFLQILLVPVETITRRPGEDGRTR